MKKKYRLILFVVFSFSFFIANVEAKLNNELFYSQFNPIVVKQFADTSVVCQGNFGAFLKQMFSLIKFAVPILIIGLSVMDFIKALTAQKNEELNKASGKLIKRLIIGAIIFVLPTIIDYLLKIAGVTSSTCGW